MSVEKKVSIIPPTRQEDRKGIPVVSKD
jgi:hypothetical protein